MGGPNATRTIEEGVVTPIYLINLPHIINFEFHEKFLTNVMLPQYYRFEYQI